MSRPATPGTLTARAQALAEALAGGEAAAIASAAHDLQTALQHARPPTAAELPQLQALAAQVHVQREAVARALAQVNQGLAALLPQASAGALYGASGHAQRARSTGLAQA